MNVSLLWLSRLLGHTLEADDAAARLAALGSPAESVRPVLADLSDVVVAEVESVEPHPNADRLSFCRVNTGTEVLDVVCGAPNVAAGKRYPYAPVGSTLPGGFELSKKKIRGVVSNGMLCSPRELELGDDHDGILELDTDAEPGTPFLDAMDLRDTVLELEVTPNRPDLLGHRGVARDLGAVLDRPVKLERIPGAPDDTRAPVRDAAQGTVGGITVSIEDAEGCPRYTAAVVEGVRVGASPEWLANRLRAIGQRPINNIVDATNYILHELNQPTHAFDRDKLRGGRVIVRRAKAGERLVTLDDQARTLDPSMTAICDAEGAAAIGGVMGGADSEVTPETTAVLIECAYFDPSRIRATRSALKMNTDASYRFERGTDPQAVPEALRRTVALVIAVAGGTEPDPPVDIYPRAISQPTVFLRPARVTHLLGVEVPVAEIERILTRLGFQVAPKDDRLAVQVPGWRPDVTREVDLIEEVARVRGYDSFEAQLAPLRPSTVPNDPIEGVKARVRSLLTSYGLHEARTLPLGGDDAAGAKPVLHPLSSDEAYLRRTLMDGVARGVARNWAVRTRDVRLFEIGTVFEDRGPDELPGERTRVAGVVSGARDPHHWSGPSIDFDRWDVKTMMEHVSCLAGPEGSLVPDGERIVLRDRDGNERGWAGPVAVPDAPAWAASVWGFELDLVPVVPVPRPYAAQPETPVAERDIALVVPDGVEAGAVADAIRTRGGGILESVRLFDEYRGGDLGGRSLAWRLVFRSRERTLRDKEVDKAVKRIIAGLKDQLGVDIRES